MEQIPMNTNQANERFMFREHIVLLSIVCLSGLNGILWIVDMQRYHYLVEKEDLRDQAVYGILQSFAPLPGIILVTFLSELHGRKPMFILLFTLSLASAIVSFIPRQKSWFIFEILIVATLKGGVLSMATLAICEYCSPKHRLAYLVASKAMASTSIQITNILYTAKVISIESSYLSLCGMMVAIACLASIRWWPESPYWLARQGRYEESRAALLWLRREGGSARKELRALETARRLPSPKLFWLALLIVFLMATVVQCASSASQFLFIYNYRTFDLIPRLSQEIVNVCVSPFVSLVIVFISYKMTRKVLFLSTTTISLALLYILSIWLYLDTEQVHKPVLFCIILLICNIFLLCGPVNLSSALIMEFVPQKYNTHISCVASLYVFSSNFFFFSLPLNYLFVYNWPLYGFLLTFASVALVGMIILYQWLLPEIRGKNLLEVEKLYFRRLYKENSQENQIELMDQPN